MKLSFKSFSLLGVALLLAACTDNEGLPIDEGLKMPSTKTRMGH